MDQALNNLLTSFRQHAKTEREKGTYFEGLVKAYLENDPIQRQQYDKVWTFSDWAKERGEDGKDTGIDLVARITETGGYCAVQCKFYDADYRVQKGDIDSFFTASGKKHFSRRIIIDSTDVSWSINAEAALDGQQIETLRIGLADLAESPIDWSIFERENRVALESKKELRPHQR